MLENNSYNIIASLYNKSQALEQYDKYIQDAQSSGNQDTMQLFQQLKQQDEQAVQQLRQHVQQLAQSEKF
jgi:F0F1-type ATP synthase membrane subunit b/b'